MIIRQKIDTSRLDFSFDWTTAWLKAGESIAAYAVEVDDAGITIDNHAQTDGVVTAWLTGGAAGRTYTLTCSVTTSTGRVDSRSMAIEVVTSR